MQRPREKAASAAPAVWRREPPVRPAPARRQPLRARERARFSSRETNYGTAGILPGLRGFSGIRVVGSSAGRAEPALDREGAEVPLPRLLRRRVEERRAHARDADAG